MLVQSSALKLCWASTHPQENERQKLQLLTGAVQNTKKALLQKTTFQSYISNRLFPSGFDGGQKKIQQRSGENEKVRGEEPPNGSYSFLGDWLK